MTIGIKEGLNTLVSSTYKESEFPGLTVQASELKNGRSTLQFSLNGVVYKKIPIKGLQSIRKLKTETFKAALMREHQELILSNKLNRLFSINTQKLDPPELAKVSIPTAPASADRDELMKIAKKLREKRKGNYTLGLNFLFRKIDNLEAHSGVPRNPQDRKILYANLDNLLKLLAVELPKKSEDAQVGALREIQVSTGFCGGAWNDEITEQYVSLKNADALRALRDKKLQAEVKLHQMLADFKGITLLRLTNIYVSKGYGDQRHVHMFLKKELGTQLGIAGKETEVKDVYSPENLKKRNLAKEFFELYTPAEMEKYLAVELNNRVKRSTRQTYFQLISQWSAANEANEAEAARLLGIDNQEDLFDDLESFDLSLISTGVKNLENPNEGDNQLKREAIPLLLRALGVVDKKS